MKVSKIVLIQEARESPILVILSALAIFYLTEKALALNKKNHKKKI